MHEPKCGDKCFDMTMLSCNFDDRRKTNMMNTWTTTTKMLPMVNPVDSVVAQFKLLMEFHEIVPEVRNKK